MPIYEYQCRRCGHRLETMQRVSDPPLKRCPECGGGLKKLISAPAFQFKGSGWYVTDYAGKGADSKEGKEARSEGKEAKSEGKADSKGEGKAKGGDGGKGSGKSSPGGGGGGD